ncbi:hypothetical protein CI105_08375 [Candidatus Izimaplasma bacterium ZiA1]|uniref:UvrD-helicase domain-containing protein n=1 Tax=Candidatus Izimoplasma sp. ZiA1 TaxID=2024899 RepID=UPI000BAA6A56|nr:hypothetical protein CI105_08375 [Candidatus Izimaplasma bacterium ZiA1]
MSVKNKLVIAAAGSGKTHSLIEEVVSVVRNEMSPHKYICVVSFTNSVSDEIISKVEKDLGYVPDNLHISTIHGFLYRFIIKPYAKFVVCSSSDVVELIQSRVDEISFIKNEKDTTKKRNLINSFKRKNRLKGRIFIDDMITTSNLITQDKECSSNISELISHVFIDEFQDVTANLNNVFERIRVHKKTKFYLVGDPEQYIMSFTSHQQSFKNLPINLNIHKTRTYDVKKNTDNWRSTQKITDFLNNFHSSVSQTSVSKHKNLDIEVIFCNEIDVEKSYKSFISYIESVNVELLDQNLEAISTLFLLSRENATLGSLSTKYDFEVLGEKNKSKSFYGYKDIMNLLIHSYLKLNIYDFLSVNGITKFYCEKIMIKVADSLHKNESKTSITSYLKEHIISLQETENRVIHSFLYNAQDIVNKSEQVFESLPRKEGKKFEQIISTIHKAKGLASDAVLVVAKTEKELLKWIETDKSKRELCTLDSSRIGYVAFSRARKLLFISCLENVNSSTLLKLTKTGVKILE